jgi:hypothetical protein
MICCDASADRVQVSALQVSIWNNGMIWPEFAHHCSRIHQGWRTEAIHYCRYFDELVCRNEKKKIKALQPGCCDLL